MIRERDRKGTVEMWRHQEKLFHYTRMDQNEDIWIR